MHNPVGDPADLAAAVADEVAEALATRVRDTVEQIGRDVLGADARLQRARPDLRRQLRLVDVVRDGASGTAQARPVLVREREPSRRPSLTIHLLRPGDDTRTAVL
jgi:hypothetical protein